VPQLFVIHARRLEGLQLNIGSILLASLVLQAGSVDFACYLSADLIDLVSDAPVAVGGLPALDPLLGRILARKIGGAEVGIFVCLMAAGASAYPWRNGRERSPRSQVTITSYVGVAGLSRRTVSSTITPWRTWQNTVPGGHPATVWWLVWYCSEFVVERMNLLVAQGAVLAQRLPKLV
jgi:hypothetical protein